MAWTDLRKCSAGLQTKKSNFFATGWDRHPLCALTFQSDPGSVVCWSCWSSDLSSLYPHPQQSGSAFALPCQSAARCFCSSPDTAHHTGPYRAPFTLTLTRHRRPPSVREAAPRARPYLMHDRVPHKRGAPFRPRKRMCTAALAAAAAGRHDPPNTPEAVLP